MDIRTVAEKLKEAAEQKGAYYMLQYLYPGRTVSIPYYHKMAHFSVDEMNPSVRASNALHRAGAITLDKVAELIKTDGLKTIRNLGVTSEKEIIRSFFILTYANMKETEKSKFWQNILTEEE